MYIKFQQLKSAYHYHWTHDLMKDNCALRQIRISKLRYVQLKQYCAHKNITLGTFYSDMIDWYFDANKKNSEFLASYKNGQKLSLWLPIEKIKKINMLANIYFVSDARVIFTALMLYSNELGIH